MTKSKVKKNKKSVKRTLRKATPVKNVVKKAVIKKNLKKAKKPMIKKSIKIKPKKSIIKKTKKAVVKKNKKQIKKPVKIVKKKSVKRIATKKPPVSRTTHSKFKPIVKIKVMGVGGGGGNALTRMSRDPLRGVAFIAVNTDLQDLETCGARRKVHIGKTITRGLGAGMNPELGQQSAEENREDIENALQGTDMLFLTAGLGGGTGTGATPVIADIARDMGILTVAVVTKPFSFEGSVRTRLAEEGLAKLRDRVDTLLVIPNDRIFNIIDTNTPVLKAFDKIDEILKSSVRGIADMITASGLVNVDFADVSTVMKDAGIAVVGVGVAKGKDRALKAVNEAINSPLLDISIDGARGVLFSVAGGRDLKMSEINEAARMITENVDASAKIIFGAHHDRKLRKGDIKIILIATGFNDSHQFGRGQDSFSLFGLSEEDQEEDVNEDDEYEKKGKDTSDELIDMGDKKPAKKIKEEVKDGEENWEIPAFLRRRKKR
ncbi:MAG: cell division protein FtsZ [Candidatus Colwellbacteria bacterium CG10_big_fil_rev_8_21_14_0_10_42_22]|uniref:Cell division protein FtsZ n=1 Tax=Candidatus Colwellbacteria bacterium CG10_big_fil_rev_8_21_14_0_10_42_22 TaxID=1974540 RepID=A0A2H0VGE5_9BACT|nr:MAG: cell division protein FtsZ [Candidatus Colwellbacteria bacterium CG10_big_fil_rev_8_21_14_0_10_42_22]